MADFGIVGLGRMGGGLAVQALRKGHRVRGYTHGGASAELRAAGLVEADSIEQLVARLKPPRVILVYVPAGPVVDAVIAQLLPVLGRGDVVADGGNSYWGDSMRRAQRLEARGIHLCDVGTSGGVEGARGGACFMVGGDDTAVARLEPILRDLSVAGGYVHAGPVGAGHFTKLVHNGIEFGMLQAIAEGVALLEAQGGAIAVADVLRAWRHGSVIRSWLIDLLEAGYRARGGMDDVPPVVEDTGEVNWLIDDALRMEVPVPVISASVMQLLLSRDDSRPWARAIAVMRHGFGGHPFGRAEALARDRQQSRIEATPPGPLDGSRRGR